MRAVSHLLGLTLLVLCLGLLYLQLPVSPYKVGVIRSGSMEPVMSIGTGILVKPAAEYRKGDIVMFRIPGRLVPVAHRIVGQHANGTFATKGDANPGPDIWATRKADVIGKVEYAPKYLGFVLLYVHQLIGAVTVAFWILFFWFAPTLWRLESEEELIVLDARALARGKKLLTNWTRGVHRRRYQELRMLVSQNLRPT